MVDHPVTRRMYIMAARFYFPGSHTCRGFLGYFDDLLPQGENRQIYLLKGGPGTGKNTLLRALAAQWEKDGKSVDYYLCAGDPNSVDAVVSDNLAAVDATLPHAMEAHLPGAQEQVIDLGACLDGAQLLAHRDELAHITREKRRHTARAHRYLAGADAAFRDSAAIYAAAVDTGALCNLRLELTQFLAGSEGPSQRLYAQAITPQGVMQQAESMLRTYTVCLDLPFGFDADCVIYPLAVALHARGTGYQVAMQPLDGKRMAHIATDTHAVTTFVSPGCDIRTLKFDEALLRSEREALSFNRAAHDLMLRQAVDSLHRASEMHARLERIYRDAMDMTRLNEITQQLLSKIRA